MVLLTLEKIAGHAKCRLISKKNFEKLYFLSLCFYKNNRKSPQNLGFYFLFGRPFGILWTSKIGIFNSRNVRRPKHFWS